MELSTHIKDLLIEHDCVIVPEFGGFIANYEPAGLDTQTHSVRPPSKRISFNKNLSSNDGLLVQTVQQNTSLNYSEALTAVREVVLNWKNVLDNNGRVSLEGIGVIYKDTDAKIRFNRDPKSGMALFSYGLQTVALQPIVRQVELEIPVVEISKETAEKPVPAPVRKKSKLKYIAAAAIFLPVAFYSYWIPAQTNAVERGFVTMADFNPFGSHSPKTTIEEGQYSKRANFLNQETFSYDHSVLKSDLLKIGDKTFVVADKTKAVIHEVETVEPVKTNTGNYHVIAGCFSKIENAQNQIEAFKQAGYDSYILDVVGGLHRVCVQSLSTGQEANTVKKAVRDMGKSAWVLKR